MEAIEMEVIEVEILDVLGEQLKALGMVDILAE